MKKLYVGIVRDHSASMRGLTETARVDFNELLSTFQKEAADDDLFTMMTVIECGSYAKMSTTFANRGLSQLINIAENNVPVNRIKSLFHYSADGGSTPLYDSVGELITKFKGLPDINDENTQVLIMALTDGEENASKVFRTSLVNEIREIQRKDNWTITFRVPSGASKRLINALGVHAGNVVEWETTKRGYEESTVMNVASTRSFLSNVKSGVLKSSTSFYANASDLTSTDVKQNLTDISREVRIYDVTSDSDIRPFIENVSGDPYVKGSAHYQLTKREDQVQDYKVIIIRDRRNGHVYTGADARIMLGLPTQGTVKVAPGDHGHFDIFIQSTSVNRKLVAGTKVLHRPMPGKNYKSSKDAQKLPATPAAVKKTVQAPKPVPSQTTQASVIQAYKDGYKDGRQKKKNREDSFTGSERDYYVKGRADGKVKKAPLYV